jgi:CheY-like chemotaxis protein
MSELRPILLVEDNLVDAELTLSALKKSKLANEIVTLHDGDEALDYLYRRGVYASRAPGAPAVIFLDLKMPKVSGIEVLRQIKGDKTLRLIPVVMLTSSREEVDLISTYELGVNGYVVKPVDFQEFGLAIEQSGSFWGVVNELPPDRTRGEPSSKTG